MPAKFSFHAPSSRVTKSAYKQRLVFNRSLILLVLSGLVNIKLAWLYSMKIKNRRGNEL
ncbi:hypothetical protein HMPREF1557_00685 [Streptococcus sobrinus W1703]|uniref:Uncharacterized protein n=1 Tax=Streptococcus sobrinus W1703 TaxID=1227275 RepID=U2JCC1_9STRE|nr:hypothetical protein HMPREF1557_00685 [Streptococcus sobrinus W1703]